MAGSQLLATSSPMPDSRVHFNRTFARLLALGRHPVADDLSNRPRARARHRLRGPQRRAGARCSAPCSSPPATRATSPSARPRSCRSASPPSRCPSSSPRRRSTPGCASPSSRSTRTAGAPKGTGLRYAVGELLTCTRCVGVWSALGLTALRVTRPREARVVNAVLGASAINDVAQAGFTWLCSRANAPARHGGARGRADRAALQPARGWRMTGRGRFGACGAARRKSITEGKKPPAAPGRAATGVVDWRLHMSTCRPPLG